MSAEENPTYVTISNPPLGKNIAHVNVMEWDARAGDYTVSHCYPTPKVLAEEVAKNIAQSLKVEVR